MAAMGRKRTFEIEDAQSFPVSSNCANLALNQALSAASMAAADSEFALLSPAPIHKA